MHIWCLVASCVQQGCHTLVFSNILACKTSAVPRLEVNFDMNFASNRWWSTCVAVPLFFFLAAFWVLATSSNFYIFTWTIFLQSNQGHSNRKFQVNCAITNLMGTAVLHAQKSWYLMHSFSSLGILSLLACVGSAPCPEDAYFLDFLVYVILNYEFILQALQSWPVCLGSCHLVQVGRCWGKDSGHTQKEHSWKIIRWYRLYRSVLNLMGLFKF